MRDICTNKIYSFCKSVPYVFRFQTLCTLRFLMKKIMESKERSPSLILLH